MFLPAVIDPGFLKVLEYILLSYHMTPKSMASPLVGDGPPATNTSAGMASRPGTSRVRNSYVFQKSNGQNCTMCISGEQHGMLVDFAHVIRHKFTGALPL